MTNLTKVMLFFEKKTKTFVVHKEKNL